MAALAGNYVNFGVFELYGDRALSDALDIALKMTLSIPLADVLAFPKVCGELWKSGFKFSSQVLRNLKFIIVNCIHSCEDQLIVVALLMMLTFLLMNTFIDRTFFFFFNSMCPFAFI